MVDVPFSPPPHRFSVRFTQLLPMIVLVLVQRVVLAMRIVVVPALTGCRRPTKALSNLLAADAWRLAVCSGVDN